MDTNWKIEKKPDKSFVIKLTLAPDQVKPHYHKALQKIASTTSLPGFRPGKVPATAIADQTSFDKPYPAMINSIINQYYPDIIKAQKLSPIINPQVQYLKPITSIDQTWELQIDSCELPALQLPQKYQDEVHTINQGQDKDKVGKILGFLAQKSVFTLPPILIQSEITRRYPQFNQASDAQQKELLSSLIFDWALDLIVKEIATEQKLLPTSEDLNSFLAKNPKFAQNMDLSIRVIAQQKVIAYLQKL